jgi:hypothetical protein
MSWTGGDTGRDIGQPSLRINIVHLGRDNQAIDTERSPGLCTLISVHLVPRESLFARRLRRSWPGLNGQPLQSSQPAHARIDSHQLPSRRAGSSLTISPTLLSQLPIEARKGFTALLDRIKKRRA